MHELTIHHTQGAAVERRSGDGWRLTIPAGGAGEYRWAQLDDYSYRKRSELLWSPPFKMNLRARLSADDLPGTWGFGFWNDPFSFGLGLQGMAQRFPALPDALWFFHGSAPNHLTFSDHHPASGMLAAVFSSARIPSIIMASSLLLAPLLAFRITARRLRTMISKLVKEDAALLGVDLRIWHDYAISWEEGKASFAIDQGIVFETAITPYHRLGLVIWIDNQFASFSPQGKVSSGTLENPQTAWLEIEGLKIEPASA